MTAADEFDVFLRGEKNIACFQIGGVLVRRKEDG